MSKNRISKSTFIRGLQCEKSLYLYKHHYQLKDPTPSSIQAVFDQGTNIGILAQELFPNGVDASPENHFKMVESVGKTQDFISQGKTIIYEATFQYNNVLAALDILVKDEGGWKAYEVKSSTKVSETYIKDAAIQYYTITNSGIDLKDISIVHINNQYTRDGELDLNQLFTIESVYDQVLEFLPRIPNEVRRLKNVIESPEVPSVDIGNSNEVLIENSLITTSTCYFSSTGFVIPSTQAVSTQTFYALEYGSGTLNGDELQIELYQDQYDTATNTVYFSGYWTGTLTKVE